MADVIQAQYVGLRTMANGCVRLTFDAPLEHLPRIVGLFGKEGDPAAIARLVDDAREAETPSEPPRRKWDGMTPAQQAGIRCNDPDFIDFCKTQSERLIDTPHDAAEFVRARCGVRSRADIGKTPQSGTAWIELLNGYQSWLTTQKYGETVR